MKSKVPGRKKFRKLVLGNCKAFILQLMPASNVHAVINGECHQVQMWALLDIIPDEEEITGTPYGQQVAGLGVHNGNMCVLPSQQGFQGYHEAENPLQAMAGMGSVGRLLRSIGAQVSGCPEEEDGGEEESMGAPSSVHLAGHNGATFGSVLPSLRDHTESLVVEVENVLQEKAPWVRSSDYKLSGHTLDIRVRDTSILGVVRPGEDVSPEEREYMSSLPTVWGVAYGTLAVLRALQRSEGHYEGASEVFLNSVHQESVRMFQGEGLVQMPVVEVGRFMAKSVADKVGGH